MAIEFGLHLDSKKRTTLTPKETETYELKPGEVYEFHYTTDHPILFSQEKTNLYIDKMLALKNGHPEYALHYLSLEAIEVKKTEFIVQISILPTEKVVKPLVAGWVIGLVVGAIAGIIVGIWLSGKMELIIESVAVLINPGWVEQKRHEKDAEMAEKEKEKVDKKVHEWKEEKKDVGPKLKKLRIPYDEETGEIPLTQEEIEKLSPEQQDLIAHCRDLDKKISEGEKLSREWAVRADEERKAAEEAGEKPPRWWLIDSILGIAGLVAVTKLIKTLRKD